MIKGIDVTLINKRDTGRKDGFGTPITEDVMTSVKNVLVYPSSTDDSVDSVGIEGKHEEYMLCIPKGDVNQWDHAEVLFWGKRWRTVGVVKEYIEENLPPVAWNKQIMVERYE